MGKDEILKYCSQFNRYPSDHADNARENGRLLGRGEYKGLIGCPSSYGMDDFEGLCFEEIVPAGKPQVDQCERCWKTALGVEGGAPAIQVETTSMVVPVSYDDPLPKEITIRNSIGHITTYTVHGWRRESSGTMTVYVMKYKEDEQ